MNMPKIFSLQVAASLLAAMLAACSSLPTHYYTLQPPAQATDSTAAMTAAFQIDVLPVEIPAQVDQQQMVVRKGVGEVTPVDTRRWIAPLGSEIRSALSADLSARLGAKDVYGLAAQPGVPTYRIKLNVRRFDSALGVYARIDAVWTVRSGDSPGPACSSSVSETVAPGYAALAEGHQRALAQIAGDIAASILSARKSGTAPVCAAKSG
ncbi:MAG: PqiC family protein [Stenotrophobium sp.]